MVNKIKTQLAFAGFLTVTALSSTQASANPAVPPTETEASYVCDIRADYINACIAFGTGHHFCNKPNELFELGGQKVQAFLTVKRFESDIFVMKTELKANGATIGTALAQSAGSVPLIDVSGEKKNTKDNTFWALQYMTDWVSTTPKCDLPNIPQNDGGFECKDGEFQLVNTPSYTKDLATGQYARQIFHYGTHNGVDIKYAINDHALICKAIAR